MATPIILQRQQIYEAEESEKEKTEDLLLNLVTISIEFQIVIRDTGVGISEENKKKLFMEFSRLADTNQQNRSGVGLGLTISRDLVKAFGGKIKVESELNQGTDFIITLKT